MFTMMKAARRQFKALRSDENGNAGIEYGLIAALVSVVIISGLTMLGTNLSGVFNKIATSLPAVGP